MKWIILSFIITFAFRTAITTPTTEDVKSTDIQSEITDNVYLTTSDNNNGAIKSDPNNKGEEGFKQESTETVLQPENSSTIGSDTLKSNEFKFTHVEATEPLVSSFDGKNDDVDPVEVLHHLNDLLKGPPDLRMLNKVKSELKNSLEKVKQSSKSKKQENDKGKAVITSTSSASGVLTIITDMATVAGHFLGSFIQILLKYFIPSEKHWQTEGSPSLHQRTPRPLLPQ